MSHSQWTCTTSITDLLRQGKRSCGTFMICNVFFNHCETSIAGITNEIAVGLEVWFLVKLTWKFNLEWSFGCRQTQIFCNQILSFRQGAWQLNSIHHYYVDVWLSHANLWVSPLLFIVFLSFLFLLDFGLNRSICLPEIWCVAITVYIQPWQRNIQPYCIIRTMQFWHTSTVLLAGFHTQILNTPLENIIVLHWAPLWQYRTHFSVRPNLAMNLSWMESVCFENFKQ